MDNTFWALIGLIIFFAIVAYFKVPGMINKALDARSARIRRELDEARALKEEAKQQLAEYQRRRREAEVEAKDIVAGAEREAAALLQDAKAKSEEYVARRTAMAEQKIAQAENDAIAAVRSSAVDIAVAAAAKILGERNASDGNAGLIDQSIGEVRSRLN
ncbi:F0F1 ATP synthase subunit B [Aureimonas glaciei]|jgi:F-type H+-transporting ATPase subunit b|uniref:ATP synthase subunit b n=1 Tax=Aureimonas glaciei TaxID=1776957 RepID=A0A916XTR3_9HYPH|nr:F0F1 ATP synthase subunit B [Aureimonas glaciei]GGD07770.1 ATP synthase subunit b 1 [Aureimonas glaciei]